MEKSWREVVVEGVFGTSDAESWAACVASLRALSDDARAALLQRYPDVERRAAASDNALPDEARRRRGAFFTPDHLADAIAALAVDPDETGLVVDLSCGSGSLLAAVRRRAPNARLLGIERELEFCAAAAQYVPDATVVWGDGLAKRDLRATAVVGNPPYVGEKNNRELFDSIHAAHDDLRRWFAPRIDLCYLFIHRALDLLVDGGRLAYLTSEYWLTATGAEKLRSDLTARTTARVFDRRGASQFAAAPGHHSLLFAATRTDGGPADPVTWHPFATVPRRTAGTALGDLVLDKQGFISGADRVSAKAAQRYNLNHDAPIFLWKSHELPSSRHSFRPVLRASRCVANAVIREAGDDWVLWLDGLTPPDLETLALLAPYRALLESRREVASGAIPWWRIWWPRDPTLYERPKLVVPRRSTKAAMCLDLSGSIVSSDCTFLVAPADVEDEIGWLTQVMHAANRDDSIAQLREYGKTKGDIMEFYSAPLRQWVLPLRRVDGRLAPLDAPP